MNQSKQIHTTTSRHVTQIAVCPDPHVHESRLVKSPTLASACRPSIHALSRVTTRQITHTRGPSIQALLSLASSPTPRRRASIDRVVVDARRVRVYRANDCANENPLVPSPPRAPARRRRPRRGERAIRRSSNPRSTIRALDATDRGANRRSGDAIARERCARIRSERIDANESMGSDRIDASRRLASASRE